MANVNLGLHSWRDFVALAAKRISADACTGGGDASRKSSGDGWSGCDSLEAAVKMATSGWQEGAQAVGRTLDNVTPAEDVLPGWQLDVAGAFPCMPAVMSGEPECFWQQQEDQRQTRRLALIVPGTYHCGVQPEEAANYAKAVAATARAIEASGIDVAIYSIDRTSGYGKRTGYGTVVREFGEPLDLAKVAFAFHPGWLRRVGFAWREMTPKACEAGIASGGYGCPMNLDRDHVEMICAERVVGVAIAMLPSVGDLHDKRALRGGDEAVREVITLFRADVDAAIKANGGMAAG